LKTELVRVGQPSEVNSGGCGFSSHPAVQHFRFLSGADDMIFPMEPVAAAGAGKILWLAFHRYNSRRIQIPWLAHDENIPQERQTIMKVLVVEDEVRLAEALQQILAKNRCSTDVSHDGESGLDQALTGLYDVIILDIMLPRKNGLEVLKELRKGGVQTPVLLLTARDEASDKVTGLDSGADDYLTKPFNTEELLARIRALGRRRGMPLTEDVLRFADTSLDISTFELAHDGKSVRLGLKEFQIMEVFMRNGQRIADKEGLIAKVWGYDSEAEYNNLEVYVSFLRKKLNHIHSPVVIKTVRGVGYVLAAEDDRP
jgi:DNA-binding response OmpR family regulator